MPYKKYHKKSPYRKRRYHKKSGGYMNTAFKALKLASQVKQLVNAEYKYIDKTYSSGQVGANAVITLLNDPAQGDSSSTRDGDSILLKNLTGRLRFVMNSSATSTTIRMVMVKFKVAPSSTPTWTSVFQYDNLESPKSYNLRFNNKILMDKTFTLTNSTNNTKIIEFVKKLRFHTQFSAGSQTINSNAVYIMFRSNEATNFPVLEGSLRLSFIDN